MNTKKLASDYAFNLFRTILKVVVPVFTLPYVLNHIGPENFGIYTYANSIISYFTMIAVLGIPTYAARAIARQKGKEALRQTVTEILIIQFISVSISIFLFFILFYPLFPEEYKSIFLILSLMLCSSYFNVEWFYTGTQKFKYIAIRSTIIKVLNVAAIFLLIRESDNCYTYALITVLTAVANGLVNFIGVLKYISFKKLNVKQHIKPVFMLFALSVTGLINSNIDKTLTGALVGPLYVGYYAIGFRITRIVQQLFTALNGIISPRIISLLADNEEGKSNKLIKVNMDYIFFLACPIIMGLGLYGKDILKLLFDDDILPAYESLLVLVGTVPVLAVLNIVRQHILLPRDRDKAIIALTIITMGSNVILNLMMVPTWKHIGASVATLLADMGGLIFGLIYIKKQFNLVLFHRNQFKYPLASLSILIPFWFFRNIIVLKEGVMVLFFMILFSAILYFITVFFLKDDLLSFYVRKYSKKKRKSASIKD